MVVLPSTSADSRVPRGVPCCLLLLRVSLGPAWWSSSCSVCLSRSDRSGCCRSGLVQNGISIHMLSRRYPHAVGERSTSLFFNVFEEAFPAPWPDDASSREGSQPSRAVVAANNETARARGSRRPGWSARRSPRAHVLTAFEADAGIFDAHLVGVRDPGTAGGCVPM